MKLCSKRRALIAAGFLAVAALVVVLWLVSRGPKGVAPGPLPDEAKMPVVVSDSTPVTFPAINTWEAPLVPLERGYYTSRETRLFRVKGEETVKPEPALSRSILITENDLPVLRRLQSADEKELTASLASIDRRVRESSPGSASLSAWAIRVIIATRQSEPGKSPGILRMITMSSAPSKVALISGDTIFERLTEYYEDAGVLRIRTAGKPGYGLLPLFPKMGQDTGTGKHAVFTRRETISLNGGVFRCWVLERSYQSSAFTVSWRGTVKKWYAPGIGLVLTLTVEEQSRRGLLGRYRVERINVLREELRELLLPSKNVYWEAE